MLNPLFPRSTPNAERPLSKHREWLNCMSIVIALIQNLELTPNRYQSHSRKDEILNAVCFCFSRSVAGAVVIYCPATSQENRNTMRQNCALCSGESYQI